MLLPLAGADLGRRFWGSPARFQTMNMSILYRKNHVNNKIPKKYVKKCKKGVRAEAYFGFCYHFFTTLPAHSVKKRAGDRDFLVWTSAVTHTSHLKTSFLKQCAGRVWKFRVRGRNGIFWPRTKKTLFFHFCFLNKPLEGTEYTKKPQKKGVSTRQVRADHKKGLNSESFAPI